MHVGSRNAVVAFAAMMAFFQPLQAQDGTEVVTARTPESAQAFLSSLLPTVFFDEVRKSYFKVEKISSSDTCSTLFEGRLATFVEGTGWVNASQNESAQLNVEWQKVEELRSNQDERAFYGYFIVIEMPQSVNGKIASLYFDVKQSRNRSLAAMTYLQETCDKSKDTGF